MAVREAETASALSSSEAPVSSGLWEGRQPPSAYVEPSYQPASRSWGILILCAVFGGGSSGCSWNVSRLSLE